MRQNESTFRCLTLIVGLVFTAIPVRETLGCKYSVRDVGFVVLDTARYRLVVCSDRSSPADRLKEILQTAQGVYSGTNVSIESALRENVPHHPAFDYLKGQGIETLPAGVLIAPDGRQFAVSISPPVEGANNSKHPVALEQVITSPARERILEQALAAHSVVLLIEGTNADNNSRARAIAKEAIDSVQRTMDSLPKPAGGPPALVVVSADESSKESVLLWSLGIDRSDPATTAVAVLFGRGRLAGSTISVPGGTATELTERLEYIGRDCECELDRSWMQGAMIPHRWDLSLQEESTRRLGFDPDSPLVKYDMGRILARGPTGRRQFRDIGKEPARDPLLGYTEMVIPDQSAAEWSDDRFVENEAETPTTDTSHSPDKSEQDDLAGTASQSHTESRVTPLRAAWVILGVLGLISFAGGAVLLARSKRS